MRIVSPAVAALLTGAAAVHARGIDDIGTISRASVSSKEVEAGDDSARPSISGNGRLVAFYSDADNLVSGEGNGVRDVFVRDRATGTTARVSLGPGGAEGNGLSSRPAISTDGHHVVFASAASNLVAGDTNGVQDIFVRDLLAQATVRVSVTSKGAQANGGSARPTISADGRFVAFESVAANLGNGLTNGAEEAYLHDRDADGDGIFDEPGAVATVRVSVTGSPLPPNGPSTWAVVSADGRSVAFRSMASNLVPGDTNGAQDVFVRDRIAGTNARVSVGTVGQQGNDEAGRPAISADGRFVAFHSDATNLIVGDSNSNTDIFVRDRDADGDGVYDEPLGVSTVRVSVSSSGAPTFGDSEDPALSADGRYVTFWSDGAGLDGASANGFNDVYLHDRDSDGDGVFDEPGAIATRRLSVSAEGTEGNALSDEPVISADGRVVAFKSEASNLVEGDGNLVRDIYVRVLPGVSGDVDGDGFVNAQDLMAVIKGWGACPSGAACPGDLDGDGMVGVSDLAFVILHWRPLG